MNSRDAFLTSLETRNKYVWKEDYNPAARRSPLAITPPSSRKTILPGGSDTVKTRTRFGSVGDECKQIIELLSQFQPQTENESYIYSEWKKTIAEWNNLKTLVQELHDRVDLLMSG